jgi:hypothetical protein
VAGHAFNVLAQVTGGANHSGPILIADEKRRSLAVGLKRKIARDRGGANILWIAESLDCHRPQHKRKRDDQSEAAGANTRHV